MIFSDIFPSLFKGVNFTSINDVPLILSNIIEIILMLTSIVAVILIMIAGIKYITSEGNPANAESAKNTLKNAIIGVILSGSAFMIVDFLSRKL